jgi:Fe-S cluster assembly protein SufD
MFGLTAARELPGPDWLRARRTAAVERLADALLPSVDEEVWRYSRIGELDLGDYSVLVEPTATDLAPEIESLVATVPDRAALVVVHDGFVVQADTEALPGGVTVAPLAAVSDGDSAIGSVLDGPKDVFGLLNDAYSAAPLLVRVPAGVTVEAPIVMVDWLATPGVAAFPRTVVQLGPGAEATLVELQSGPSTDSLAAPIAELDVGPDARLTVVTVQQRSSSTWTISEQATRVAQQATFVGHQIGLGGDYARSRVDCRLTGRGATGNLRAAYFGEGEQMLDYRTFQGHVAPDTTSDLLFKGAVSGTSRSVYTGLIHVAKDARGTNAFQTNRNVKLSNGAWAESVPNLEIENNDVRCSHASTVGPIDEDQRFYLESRGVPPEAAERLIVAGFFDEVIAGLPVAGIAELVRAEIDRRLVSRIA